MKVLRGTVAAREGCNCQWCRLGGVAGLLILSFAAELYPKINQNQTRGNSAASMSLPGEEDSGPILSSIHSGLG